MKVASDNIPKQGVGVVSVSLADNGLRDVRGVEALATTFPDLKVFNIKSSLTAEFKSPKQQYNKME